MLAAFDVHSNPISAFYRMLFINRPFIDINNLQARGVRKENLEYLVESGLDRQHDARFLGKVMKYAEYIQEMEQSLNLLQGKEIVFLDFTNLQLQNSFGKYRKIAVDDFDNTTAVAKVLMEQSSLLEPFLQDCIGDDVVFFRMSTYDFPFIIEPRKSNPYVLNPFYQSVHRINKSYHNAGRTALGSFIRFLNQAPHAPSARNYESNSAIFSIDKYHKQIRTNGAVFFESSYQEYRAILNIDIDREEYKRLCESAILLNREIIKKKYSTLLQRLGVKTAHLFMLEGDVGKPLLEKIGEDTGIRMHTIGGKLLTDTKYKPQGKILEPQSLNRFFGWLTAHFHGDTTQSLVTARTPVDIPIPLEESAQYPFIKFGKGASLAAETALARVPKEEFTLLKKDIIHYQFRILPIEMVLYALNKENFYVYTDQRVEKSWREVLGGNTVHPLYISDLQDIETSFKRDTRPSNSSSKCALQQYISMLPPGVFPSDIQPNDHSRSGTLIHFISNAAEDDERELLKEEFKKMDVTVLARKDYCEVPILHRYTPSTRELEYTLEKLMIMEKNSESILPKLLREEFESLPKDGLVIKDGGSPDAVAIIKETLEPVIIDYKRRVARRTPVESFFRQTARYALSIIDNKKLDVKKFYLAIIQTPYTPLVQSQTPTYDHGNYRDQVIRIREVSLNSPFVLDVKAGIIIEYLNRRVFKNNPDAAIQFQAEQRETQCDNCLINKPQDYKCAWLLAHRKEPWSNTEPRNLNGTITPQSQQAG